MASLRFLLLACAISSVALGGSPNLEGYKKNKADAAAKKDAAAAKESKMAAVNKVLSLLDDILTKVKAEAEDETAAYDKFACWCKDTAAAKAKNIKDANKAKDEAKAAMKKQDTERTAQEKNRDAAEKKIKDLNKKVAEKTKAREETAAKYNEEAADLSAALASLEGAIKSLKASRSFLQIQGVKKTVQKALLMAQALGFGSADLSFLSFDPADNKVNMDDYKFHSEKIIKMLEDLQKDFIKTKNDVDQAEVKSIQVYDMAIQGLTHEIHLEEDKLEDAKQAISAATAAKEKATEDFSIAVTNIGDDSEYATELNNLCVGKKKTYDTRSEVRANEIQALTTARTIIAKSVSKQTKSSTIRLAQETTQVHFARSVANSPQAMEEIEAEAEEVEQAPAFIQVAAPADGRQVVVELLSKQAKVLKSTLLSQLTAQIQADPFAKIKVLIQSLIERLLDEASKEADRKGFCDKNMGDAEQRRDLAANKMTDLDNTMSEEEVKIATLKEEIAKLAEELAELKKNLAEATKERLTEKQENEMTVLEAKHGLEAVRAAIKVLKEFYDNPSGKKAALVQGPLDDAPDAGFDNNETYGGAQSENDGVVGMLEVIESDFVRTVDLTEEAEQKAVDEFREFETETKMSIAKKTVIHDKKEAQHSDTETSYDEHKDALSAAVDDHISQVNILQDLQKSCVDTGMSYEERVKLREQEMEALKKALCILEAYQTYGPDGLADAC